MLGSFFLENTYLIGNDVICQEFVLHTTWMNASVVWKKKDLCFPPEASRIITRFPSLQDYLMLTRLLFPPLKAPQLSEFMPFIRDLSLWIILFSFSSLILSKQFGDTQSNSAYNDCICFFHCAPMMKIDSLALIQKSWQVGPMAFALK